MPANISIDRQQIADFCERHHIRKLWFFGSVLTNDFRPDSDVDALYEFEDGFAPGWDIDQIEEELSSLLGRKVDLVPAKYLSHWIRDRIMAGAEVQYVR
ncbi:MAG TPA: nucleotidyltransferase domain-containing protein [Tepidisphaeraceae bacterium]|nr:nucleotidyltransferase domain-containing protein [Tepidisphaeraceae bacterium]